MLPNLELDRKHHPKPNPKRVVNSGTSDEMLFPEKFTYLGGPSTYLFDQVPTLQGQSH